MGLCQIISNSKNSRYSLFLVLMFTSVSMQARPLSEIGQPLDKQITMQMKKNHVPGLTIAVVQDQKIVYKRGFGYADLEKKTPVDPDLTLFRMGSISKLFTWTAAMQLEEQDGLNLNTDINEYLKNYKVKDGNYHGQPIHMHHLMGHTAGFSARMIDLFTYEESRRKNLADVIQIKPALRIRPPGKLSAYSNYGSSLAGFVTQEISGKDFEVYIKENIFDPLGMHHATFYQPIPATLSANQAQAYYYDTDSGKHKIKRFEIVQGAPAGGLSASAENMARFLIAHINEGRGVGGKRILKKETARRMHQGHFRLHPRANGFAHGFFEMDLAGVRILGHGGDTMFFHSIALFAPDKKIGLIISTNGDTGRYMVYELARNFIYDYLVPEKQPKSKQRAMHPEIDLSQYTGAYQMSLRAENELTKIMLLGTPVVMAGDEPGILLIPDILKGDVVASRMVEKDIFQAVDGYERFIFVRNEAGEVYGFINNFFVGYTFLKPPLLEHPVLHLSIIIWCVIMLIVSFIITPTGILGIFKYHNNRKYLPAIGSSLLVPTSYLVFFIILLLSGAGVDPVDIIFEPVPVLPLLIPYLALFATLAMLYFCMQAYRKQWWTPYKRLFYTIATISHLFFFWQLWFWNFVALGSPT